MNSMPATSDSSGLASHNGTGEPTTIAAFSPASSTYSPSLFKQRQTILVHQKSPLLVATPPQITRALAYSHPFLLPLNKFVGLLSWTTDDPWESFLLLACYWGIVIYGDYVIRIAGPVLVLASLILGLYSRRYSPLSSTWTPKEQSNSHQRKESDSTAAVRHHKSLDEIVEVLKIFTSRCNVLLDPFIRLTDFLSTQRTATTASTRPSLMTLLIRILLISPVWYLLTLPPLCLITTKRVMLTLGTLVLSWHSKPARTSRVILWRSRFVRQSVSFITGLSFSGTSTSTETSAGATLKSSKLSADRKLSANPKAGIRFTFSLYENQRRWLGIGWTSSMLAYERDPWTDEELNPAPPKEKFELPAVEGGIAKWRWCKGSRWTIEGEENEDEEAGADSQSTASKTKENDVKKPSPSTATASTGKKDASIKAGGNVTSSKDRSDDTKQPPADGGWMYYDTKWRFPRRQDGWGKYTRRRKWVRAAELIELTPASTPANEVASPLAAAANTSTDPSLTSRVQKNGRGTSDDTASVTSTASASGANVKRQSGPGWFTRSRVPTKSSATTALDDGASGSFSLAVSDREDNENDGYVPMPFRGRQGAVEAGWGVGEDVGMELG